MKVVVYSSPTCPWCYKAKDYLRENNISFIEKDISKDYAAAIEMMRKSKQQGVPVLDINGDIIVGFDKENINRLLGL